MARSRPGSQIGVKPLPPLSSGLGETLLSETSSTTRVQVSESRPPAGRGRWRNGCDSNPAYPRGIPWVLPRKKMEGGVGAPGFAREGGPEKSNRCDETTPSPIRAQIPWHWARDTVPGGVFKSGPVSVCGQTPGIGSRPRGKGDR